MKLCTQTNYKHTDFKSSGTAFLLSVYQVLLQSGTGITKWDDFITNWDGYYKVGQLLESGL